MGGWRGEGWATAAALAVSLAITVPGAVSLAQKPAALTTAQSAQIDPLSIPPDVRAETAAETSRRSSYFATANGLEARGDFRAAEQKWREAVALFETTWGLGHPATAIGLNNLALNLNYQGRTTEAETLYRRALSIDEARLGSDCPETATILNNLGGNLNDQRRYAEAESFLRRALAIRETRLGANDVVTATTLSQLARNLNSQSRYVEAEPLFRRWLSIDEAQSGADHPHTAVSLNNLAENLHDQGQYASAEPLYRRALSIRETQLGADHPDTAVSLNNLALNLDSQGRYANAEPLYRRALSIEEARFGADSAATALGLNNLASNLERQGGYAAAEPLYRRALAIREARLGADHWETAVSLNNLALNLDNQGRYIDAEPLYRRALSIFEARLGADHPNTANSAENLALVELALSHFDMALSHSRAALRARESLRIGANAAVAESTRGQLASASENAASYFTRAAWSVGARQPAQAPTMRAEAFEAAQAIRASSSADALAQGAARIAAERAGAGPAVAAWRGAQDRIAAIDSQVARAAGLGAEGDARRSALGTQRATAVTQLASAERALSARFPRYFDLLKSVPVSVADLQATTGDTARLLGTDEALVVLTPGTAWMPEGQRKGLVFVVTKQTSAWAEIPLEPDALAAEITALHAMLADEGTGATWAPNKPAPSVLYDRARAFALCRALFGAQEIRAALAGKTRWLIAPQGPLMSLPFAALPTEPPTGSDVDATALRSTVWLGIERTLAILPSVSALRVQRLYPLERAQTARMPFFGLGDPAFRGVADGDVRSGGELFAARSYFRGGVADPATFSRLPRLPDTAREIRTLASNLGASPDAYVLQLDATEAELRRRNATGALGRAEIIAFATHGLVAGEFQNSIAEPALALTPPLLAGGAQLSSGNDGLLTASEAATLTLSARFVILSACNTASGGKPDADALSGLARAFFYVGARSLLVSHYPVFDDAAMRLTTEAARLSRGGAIRNPEAMQGSMRALMQDANAGASGLSYAHPKAWAPFAVVDAN